MRVRCFLITCLLVSACKDETSNFAPGFATNTPVVEKTNQPSIRIIPNRNNDKPRAIILISNQFETSFQKKYLHKTPYSKHLADILQQQLNDVSVDKNEITRTISILPDIEPNCLIELKNIIDSFYKELENYYKLKNQLLYYSTETMPAYVPKGNQMIELENSNRLAKQGLEAVISFLKSNSSNNICNN
jgi:hypothetical protein